jgi:DNA polymerase-3 subunit chi
LTEIDLYELGRTPSERVLPKLLERVLERGKRAVVMLGSDERVEALNAHLWTYAQRSFLPHGAAGDGFAEDQPIYLTSADENPNAASILLLLNEQNSSNISEFERCLEIFNGNDSAVVERARERADSHRAAGHTVTYWRQREGGGWDKAG